MIETGEMKERVEGVACYYPSRISNPSGIGRAADIAKLAILTVIAGVLLSVWSGYAYASPFTGGGNTRAQNVEKTAKADSGPSEGSVANESQSQFSEPGVTARAYTAFMRTITYWQKDVRRTMSAFGREIQQQPWGGSFWAFVGLAFLYGVIHALGPGHGKSVVFSYFLGRQGSVKANIVRGFIMGHLLTFVHVLSAVVVVMALQYLFVASGHGSLHEASGVLQQVSYGLIAALGGGMMIHAVYEMATGKIAEKACCSAAPEGGWNGLATVSVIAGLVPCPAAALVLSFSLGLGIPHAGYAAVVVLGIGMGLTTSIFGILSIVSGATLRHVAGRGPKTIAILHGLLSFAGAACIAAIGAVMLAGTL